MEITTTKYQGVLESNRKDNTLALAKNIAFDENKIGEESNDIKSVISTLQQQINEINNLLNLIK